MELSVYISNERIEIVAGTGSKSKAKIKKVYSLAVPEGTIMNGIITGGQRKYTYKRWRILFLMLV